MKRTEIIFNVASLPLDAVMLSLSGLTAFYARPRLTEFVGPVLYQLSMREFLLAGLPALAILLGIFALLGLYSIQGPRKLSKEILRVLLGISAGLFVLVILFFFDPGLFPSRFIVLASWGLGVVLVSFGRAILKYLQYWTFKNQKGLHRIVIVNGAGKDAGQLEHIYKNQSSGFQVVRELHFTPQLTEELEKLFRESSFDEVIQANTSLKDEDNLQILEWCRSHGLSFSFVPTLFQVRQSVVEISTSGGVPLISIKNTPLDGWGKVAKRVMDIVVSGLAMLVLSPVYLIIYIAVKLDSPGPAIYPALRAGKSHNFWFYKFRSMYTHLSPGLGGEMAEKFRENLWQQNDRGGKDAPFLKVKQDPRVTKVGRIIRKTKLDEIPQFWNVLKGDMSLIGPRAHVLDEVDRYKDKHPRVFSIKPGIFGVAQIEQMNWPDLPFEEEMRLSIYYIENWSLWMDVKLLVKSAYLIFFGKKPKEDY